MQDATVVAKVKDAPNDDQVEVVFELHEPSSLLCRAAFVIATDTEAFVKEFWTSGTHAVSFRHVSLFSDFATRRKLFLY